MTTFGDYEPLDARDTDQTIAPEWVARRLHELLDGLDRMRGGRGLRKYDLLPYGEYVVAMLVAERFVALVRYFRGLPDGIAEGLHEYQRDLGSGEPEWAALPADVRELAIALVRAVVSALELEGHVW